ncbi:MAG: Txe/YoeB family addiction module toxin [Candidatus Latescibacteria bacterium]|nr:Txe/YoeB family addiction module toxin [Candidatus Latescibacterota bacterium]
MVFAEQAWEDDLYWQEHDPRLLVRINTLIRDIQRAPFAGLGKPGALKHALDRYWSRRTDDEYRIVYKAPSDALLLAQRYRY